MLKPVTIRVKTREELGGRTVRAVRRGRGFRVLNQNTDVCPRHQTWHLLADQVEILEVPND